MRRSAGQRGGAALPAALVALAVSAALTAALADLARTEVVLARHRLMAATALAAADTCLAEVVAALPAGWDATPALAGPDATTGTADDGTLATPAGCTAAATAAPGLTPPPSVRVTVDAWAGGGHRALEAIVGRTTAPGVQALLWLDRIDVPVHLTGTLAFDGADREDPTSPAAASVGAQADPGALDGWVAGQGSHLVSSASTGSPIWVPSPPLATLGERVRAAGPAGPEALVGSGTPSPAVVLAPGDLVVDSPRSGAGLLFVEGVLDVRATMAFAGAVVARGGVRVATGADLTVAGGLWVGTPTPGQPSLWIDGLVTLQQDRAALAATDGMLPLPRRAAVLGLRDLG